MNIAITRLEELAHHQRSHLRGLYIRHRGKTVLTVSVVLLVLAIFWHWIFVTVPAGHVGVMWYRFSGTKSQSDSFRRERSYLIWPWDKMAIYDARVQQVSRDFDVLTRDGMTVGVSIAVRFRLNTSLVGLLHKDVGPAYVETLLLPGVGAYARMVFAQNSTDDVYATRRSAIQDEIKQTVAGDLRSGSQVAGTSVGAPYLFVQDILITSIRFPPDVQAAVNRKMEQYQLQQEYSYRLERERLESQRKEIEAQGIARFQSIVGAGSHYLRWKGVDAMLALAQSRNSKVIVFGGAKDGLPLILGETPYGASTPGAEGAGDAPARVPEMSPPAAAEPQVPPGP